MIFICCLLWTVSLSIQAAADLRMQRISGFERLVLPRWVMIFRWICPLTGLWLCANESLSTAIFVWLGTFSVAAVLVAVGWATGSRWKQIRKRV